MIRDNTIIIIIIIIYYYCLIMALDNSESWKAGLNKKGVYYQGMFVDMQKVLDQHALATGA